MGEHNGWVCLHRSLQNNFLWEIKPFSMGQAWVDLIMLANREDKKAVYHGNLVEFKKGTINRSILWLSDRWGWDRKKTRKFLKILEIEKMATTESTTHGTTITIVNYDTYQTFEDNKKDNKMHNNSPTKGQPLPTNNNNNNNNNINKKEGDKPQRVFIPPTVDEVTAYCKERKNGIDAQSFIDFYESKGWMIGKNKMKDWKAAVRTWERRGGKSSKIEIDNKFRDFLEQNQVVDFGM